MSALGSVPITTLSAGRRKKGKPTVQRMQAKAYVAWKERRITDWWKNKLLQKDPPNQQRRAFMERIMNRCRQEFQSFSQPTATQYKDDPIFDCLFGIPGAGK
eukprot:6342328-Karenia_brevis.AAC.1